MLVYFSPYYQEKTPPDRGLWHPTLTGTLERQVDLARSLVYYALTGSYSMPSPRLSSNYVSSRTETIECEPRS